MNAQRNTQTKARAQRTTSRVKRIVVREDPVPPAPTQRQSKPHPSTGYWLLPTAYSRARRAASWLLLALPLLVPATASAQPTQEDVFKSISDNVSGNNVDVSKFLPFFLAGAGLVLLVAVISQRRKREISPKALNHPGKLTKEVLKQLPLRPAEMKQLRILAEDANGEGDPLTSPLTLLLCPSVLARQIQRRNTKVDRKATMSLARKMGLSVARKTPATKSAADSRA